MRSNEPLNFKFSKSPKKLPRRLTDPTNLMAVYTVLCVLRNMREKVCLEAMLEYMEEYLDVIEKHNPELKSAVSKAMSKISIEKIYKDAML